jgi:mannose-6-phosphate isomerase
MKLYPLTFKPILKERIWGGNQLKTLFNKPLVSDKTGESWEISTVGEDQSLIANGIYSNKSFTSLITKYAQEILGEKVHRQFGPQFPLLFKFIDTSASK